MKHLTACLVISIAALAGCATDSSSTDIAATTLSGQVNGVPWTFAAGQTDAFLSEGQNDFFATLYPTTFTPCGFSEPSGPHLIVAIPKVVGDYDMSLSRNMTFVNESHNMIAIDGRIEVDDVTAMHVAGGLHGTYDGANEVNGQFDLTVCANTN